MVCEYIVTQMLLISLRHLTRITFSVSDFGLTVACLIPGTSKKIEGFKQIFLKIVYMLLQIKPLTLNLEKLFYFGLIM